MVLRLLTTEAIGCEKMLFSCGTYGVMYFNFLYSPNGGAYQNSLSFVETLISRKFSFKDVVFLVYESTEIHTLCVEREIPHKAIKNGVFYKMVFELYFRKNVNCNDIVFSIFGPPILFTDNHCLNIGGMAISNVFYKDVDFWAYLGPVARLLKRLKDFYRVLRYKKLDCWIFETDLLKKKAVEEFGFPEDRCFIIKMAPSVLVAPRYVLKSSFVTKVQMSGKKHRFLFLTGSHPNKRLHLLPRLANCLVDNGFSDFAFILTSKSDAYLESLMQLAESLGVVDYFVNIGPVRPNEVATIVDSCSYVCTFSLLESFSNNFVEAWAMNKPLIVTDAEWARSSCEDAALYVNVDIIEGAAKQILLFINDHCSQKEMIENGKRLLQQYPSADVKTDKYLEVIDIARKLGKISHTQRGRITL